MAKKKPNRLGKGLDALLSTGVMPEAMSDGQSTTSTSNEGLKTLPVEFLQKGRYQPRSYMDEAALNELAASIKAQGIVQPIVVRKISDNRYEIIAGHRRWRAAQIAAIHEVPVVVRDIPDQAAMAMSLIENIQREDLSPIEEATALERLQIEFSLTHDEIAETIGRSRSAVTNILRLLKLSPSVRRHLEDGEIEMGHARALLALPTEDQERAASNIIQKQMTVRQAEAMVKNWGQVADKPKPTPEPSGDVKRLISELSDRLGSQVQLKTNAKGDKGQLIIEYHSLDELDGIIAKIK